MLLAVDTSTVQVGLALYDGTSVISELLWQSRQHHTIELAPALAELLMRTGVMINDLQALAVAIGPGSFTSLRVGLAFIKGLSLARHLPVVGVPTLDVLAAAQPASKMPLVTVLQAGRGRIAVGRYKYAKSGWTSKEAAHVTTIDGLADSIGVPTIVCGELTAEERQRLARKKVNVVLAAPTVCVRRPSVLAELAWTRWQAGDVNDVASLAPIYLQVAGSIPA